jgi:hypothetical protein
MSEKHLTELPWKTMVVKQGLKDPGLQKALVVYAKLDANKEPAKALDALKEISELAIKLKKTYAAKTDVVEHLEEMVKEVKKTTPTLEAKVNTAEKPAKLEEGDDEESELAEFKKDLKKQMVSAMAQVKARAPEPGKEPKPQLQFMAYLAGKSCSVIVSKRVGAATKKLLQEFANGASGGQYAQGECIFEKNMHTFVLAKVPSGLARKLATALQTETGTKFRIRVRSTDGLIDLDSETDVDTDTTTTPVDEMAKFRERLATLVPRIKEKPQVKANAGTKDEKGLNVVASEAGAMASKKEYAKAHQMLDLIESMLKNAGSPTGFKDGDFRKAWPEAKKSWQLAIESVDTQIAKLQSTLKSSGDEDLQEIAKFGLSGLTGNFKTPLMAVIAEIESAQGDALVAHARKAVELSGNFLKHITSSPKIEACDENPFGVQMTIRKTLGDALSQFNDALKMAGAG